MIQILPRQTALRIAAAAVILLCTFFVITEKGHAAARLTLSKTTNLYNSPDTSSKPVTSLSPQTVTVLQQKGTWYQIETPSGAKWVQVESTPVTKTANETVQLLSRTPAYDKPSKSAPVVTYFSPQSVKVLKESGDWLQISTGIGPKWIHKETTSKWTRQPQPALETVQLLSRTPAYDKPSKSAPVVTYFSPQSVKVLKESGDWLQISTGIGPKWIHKETTSKWTRQPQPALETVQLLSRTPAYDKPSKSAPVVTYFSPQSVKVLKESGDWLQISTGIGPKWIHKETTSKWTILKPAGPLNNVSIIAHGLGQIGGYRVTNSIDALHYNYSRGIRVFEADLIMTSDNRLVARHDWGAYHYAFLGQNYPAVEGPIPFDTVMNLPIYGTYKSTSFEDILDAMKKYPDLIIITDTKDTDKNKIQKTFSYLVAKTKQVDPALLDRIVPQIYHQPMLGYIKPYYSFKHVIYTLYQEPFSLSADNIIQFSRANSIDAITMSDTRYSASLVQKLNAAGLHSFVHTINDAAAADKYKAGGVTGVYTDYLLYSGNRYILPK